jgi:hypothetical protein
MNQFAEYVHAKNLTVDKIFYSSARLERHRVGDRKLRVRREELRRSGKGSSYAEAGVAKPRSGRGVSRQRIEAALAGQPLTSTVRAKLTRAVAALAGQSGGELPTSAQLFGDVQSRHGGATAAATPGQAA